jgi:hypothetical protein
MINSLLSNEPEFSGTEFSENDILELCHIGRVFTGKERHDKENEFFRKWFQSHGRNVKNHPGFMREYDPERDNGGEHEKLTEANSTAESRVEKAADAIRNDKTETAIAFDAEGVELFKQTGGEPARVEFTKDEEEIMRKKVYYLIHNHPGGTSLSAGDLRTMFSMNVPEAMVVTAECDFILANPNRTPESPNIDPQEFFARYERLDLAMFKNLYKKFLDGKLIENDIDIIHTDAINEAMADEFGLDYRGKGVKR